MKNGSIKQFSLNFCNLLFVFFTIKVSKIFDIDSDILYIGSLNNISSISSTLISKLEFDSSLSNYLYLFHFLFRYFCKLKLTFLIEKF